MIQSLEFNELKRILDVPKLRPDIVYCQRSVTPLADLRVLYRIARSISPMSILEIGTSYGHTSLGLALNCPAATVYTMDICREMGIVVPESQIDELLPRREVGKMFAGRGLDIVQLFRDSRRPSSYTDLPSLDFSFIDGNHSFDAVVADSLNVLRASRGGATIVWHDYKNDQTVSVIQALHHFSRIIEHEVFHIADTMLAFMMVR